MPRRRRRRSYGRRSRRRSGGLFSFFSGPKRRRKRQRRQGFFGGRRRSSRGGLFFGRRRRKFSLLGFLFKWSFVLLVWGMTLAALVVLYYAHDMPDISHLKDKDRNPSVTIVADSKTEYADETLALYGDLVGEFIDVAYLPPHLVHAIMATEDRRFYDHMGIDMFGLIRAAYHNYRAGYIVQGGSTITQQLAKNIFLTPERSIKRKVQEMMMAFWLEHHFTKDEILSLYLNRVYMGAGNYGIQAASRHFFGKPATDLTLYESAILAGMLKAPSRYSPTNNIALAEGRADQVLINMADAGFLSVKTPIRRDYTLSKTSHKGRGILKNPHFADWVLTHLPHYVDTIEDDIIIETTLDLGLQRKAETILNSLLKKQGKQKKASEAAMIVMSREGEILAMVGGMDYSKSQFNRATQAKRQPGSAFKLFVYLTAFEKGLKPDEIVIDKPIKTRNNWSPGNYNETFDGIMTLEHAFAKSINTIAVATARKVGVKNVIHTAKKLGIESSLNPDLSIALGTGEVNLLELTRAYAYLANDGKAVDTHGIKTIYDKHGNTLYQRPKRIRTHRAISHKATAYMDGLLRQVVEKGTGRRANLLKPAAGKTGTSQNYKDAWFIGYTDDLIAGIWIGNDNSAPMRRVTGGTLPATAWKQFMQHAKRSQTEPSTTRTDSWDKVLDLIEQESDT